VKQQHTSTATSILTTKSTYRSLSAQRLSERTVEMYRSAPVMTNVRTRGYMVLDEAVNYFIVV
jgi:hydroxyacyl-ACP dehydratase HTD2-like protein with hotdog domain